MVMRLKGALKLMVFRIHLYLCTAIDGNGGFLQQLFGCFHHPQIIFIRNVEFEYGEFRIMRSVHSFITEVPAENS